MRVHRIEIPTPFPVGPVNAYLLEGDPLTLVDTGPKGAASQDAIESALVAAGRGVTDLRRIVITHGHTDHFGQAEWLRAQSGAEVFAHASEQPKLAGERWVADHLVAFFREAGMPESFFAAFSQMVSAYRVFFDPLEAFTPLVDGDTLAIGDERLRVLHCPGHSQGHVCLYHDDGVLIAGDLLLEEVSPNPIVEFSPDGRRQTTLPQYLHSLRRVLLLNCDLAYPGHGEPITNPSSRIRELIAHHEQRKEEIAARLGRAPKTLVDLTQEIYHGLDDLNLMLALSEVIGHLDLLAEEKRIATSRRRGTLLYRGK
ncbi:MAG TPA: MBL fold metallo-hydrolase [bacterium]|jgi:glyoxylase-like metal-dependent hydrolase (beta-lactamase superfamily II)|nr:MBL fold metallo-hydrolase [bacterium]